MRCPECGEETAGYAVFCEMCGASLEAAGEGAGEGRAGDTVLVGEASPGAGASPGGQEPSSPTILVSGKTAGAGSFGRYRVLREVGRGAMGVVFLARDDRIGRNVAIKALRIDANLPEEDKAQVAERFEREARAAGMLSHPNIVTVHDVGEQDGVPYIAMEYLEGATLAEKASEGPLSIEQASRIISQVLSALAYAHARDVVHRDIKPDNAFILPDGRVKVADFGIARISSSVTMTQVGQVMGTPGYMSPEQVRGETVGPPSDIFSAGVLLYELLTGAAAFGSTSATSIMYKIVHEEPTAAHLVNPAVPLHLEAVIAKATAKDPQARYCGAAEMRDDIESGRAPEVPAGAGEGTILRSEPVPLATQAPLDAAAAATPNKKRTALLVGLGGGGALLVVILLILLVVLLPQSGAVVKIVNPAGGSDIKEPTVKVSLDIKNPGKVSSITVFVDQKQERTLDAGSTEVEIPNPAPGSHTITVTAYDRLGVALSTAMNRFNSGYRADADLVNQYLASVTASTSTRDTVNGFDYPPDNIRDNNEATCWATNLRKDPAPVLVFTFNQPVVLSSVYAIPGYKKFSDVDRYLQNPKPNQVVLTFDDQTTEVVTFDPAPGYAALAWQTKPLTKPVTTRAVKVTVANTYPGQNMGGGHTASSDLSISEFHFLGHPAAP